MQVLRKTRNTSAQHEVLLLKDAPGEYEAEARALGIKLHRLPLAGAKLSWPIDFFRFLRGCGPYAAVHAHCLPHFNLVALGAARLAGVPIRIAHNHSARTVGVECSKSLRYKTRFARNLLGFTATARVGISEAAIQEIGGAGWDDVADCRMLLYGFDFSAYRDCQSCASRLRAEHGLSDAGTICGMVGRLVPVKNHAFLIEAFSHVVQSDPSARLVIVGEGELEPVLRQKVAMARLDQHVIFVGASREIPAYMALFDVLCLPSDSEGLGIVAVEAQAAGTPVVVSDGVPAEVSIVPGAVSVVPLAQGARAWSDAILAAARKTKPDESEALRIVEASRFNLDRCIKELHAIYRLPQQVQ